MPASTPLSYSQQALWFIYRDAPQSAAYNMALPLRFSGDVDGQTLQQAVRQLMQRHSMLRSRFAELDGVPYQSVVADINVPWQEVDAAGWTEQTLIAELHRHSQQPFVLEQSAFRATLFQGANTGTVLLLSLHHIAGDAASLAILGKELPMLYAAEDLPPTATVYGDYVRWEAELLSGNKGQRMAAYWQRQLAGDVPVLQLPTDYPRPPLQTFNGASVRVELPEPLTAAVKSLVKTHKTTLFTLLFSAYQVLLQRYSGQDDIWIGVPTSTPRNHSEFADMVGYLVNPMIMRGDFSKNVSFSQVLQLNSKQMLTGLYHQPYPFTQLIELLQPQRNLAYPPLVQAMFALERDDLIPKTFSANGLTARRLELAQMEGQFDLTLTFSDSDDGKTLAAAWSYNSDLFTEATIARMAEHLHLLLQSAVDDAEQMIATMPLLTDQEQALLKQWNQTEADYPKDLTIVDLFERQVETTPDNSAVVFDGRSLSYRQLNDKANRLAHNLLSLKTQTGTALLVNNPLIAIAVERSADMIIGLLAILKAGGAYLPIDPAYPAARIRYMLDDSQAPLLLTQSHLPIVGHNCAVLYLDEREVAGRPTENPARQSGPEDLAYVIYTSGSTGLPKGVMIEHKSLINLCTWHIGAFAVQASDKATLLANSAFDASVLELWPYLATGACVMPANLEALMAKDLWQALNENTVSISFLPTPIVNTLSDYPTANATQLRLLVTGGDTLHHCPNSLPCPLINAYGPTESTVVATSTAVMPNGYLGIGRPIANTRIFILNAGHRPQPPGIPGELCIAGAGLARGYLNQAELTAEKFIDVELFGKTERLYKTGDLARWLPSGNLEFLGRVDRQIKLRGFRIELGEIEAVLNQHSDVKEAAALLYNKDGNPRLVAYVTLSVSIESISELLQTWLKAYLPNYMVPSNFMVLDKLPLTPNGKIDRKALPEPDIDIQAEQPPHTETEHLLCSLWSQLLRVDVTSIGVHFFATGGHSLLATQLVSRIRESFDIDMPLRTVFEYPILREQAEWLDRQQRGSELPDILPLPEDEPPALSFAQQRLWFLAQLAGQSASYNIPTALRLEGRVNEQALQSALTDLVQRHQTLHVCFPMLDGQPTVQVNDVYKPLSVTDLSGLADAEQKRQVAEWLAGHAGSSFDLSTGPLFKAQLLRLGSEQHILLFNMHHIISDGWSTGVMIREWCRLYDAYLQNREAQLPELAIQYSDYAAWQRNWLQGAVLERQLEYWTDKLLGAPELLELPADNPRPAVMSYRGEHLHSTLNPVLTQAIKQLNRKHGVTDFMALLAAFTVLLSRHSGQTDIVVGCPIANRSQSQAENLIGFFVNTLALRLQIDAERSFTELLKEVRKTALEAYSHQDIPFEALVEKINPSRSLSYSPLFQVMFVLQNAPEEAPDLSGLNITPLESDHATAKFDLTLSVEEQGGAFVCNWEYNTDLFRPETIVLISERFQVLLEGIITEPEQSIAQLPLLTVAEQQLLQAWNRTENEYPQDQTIVDLFQAQAGKTPDAIAVVFEDRQLSYRELNQQANQLAHYLLDLKTGNCLIGICVERSLAMIVGLLAIVKAGAAYVPLDPDYPAQRLQFILDDAAVPVLLTQSHLLERLPAANAKVVCMDKEKEAIARCSEENPAPQSGPDDLAYVIYTSGSTGKPKGCQLTQANVTRLFFATDDWYRFNEQDVWTVFHSYAFDFSVWEIWGALFYGGKLVVVPHHTSRNPSLFYQLLIEQGVTVLNQTPSAFRQLQDVDKQPDKLSLRLVIFGGEALDFAALQPWFCRHGDQQPQLVNMYGITETTVHVTYYPVLAGDNHGKSIIGKPIPDLQVWVVDACNNLLPIGVPGEMLVGGAGVARGYLNRPELTAERFIDIELFGLRQRVYKSGDLARWLPDGNIEYLGRIDNQVKIRGFRIELGEIEACLISNPAVKEAVVLPSGEGEAKALVAYVSANSVLKVEELRAGLNALLPCYMVPAYFVQLDALPLLPNGKINRKSLIGLKPIESSREFRPPQNELEAELLSIWQKYLEADHISTNASFFEVGGNSLSLVRVHWDIEKNYPQTTLMDLFAYPNIADLALFLSGGNSTRMTIETLPLDKKYFSAGAGGLLEYSLDAALAAQLNGRKNQDAQDILRAAFGYLLFEISDQKQVPYYAALNEQQIISVRHDFEAIDSITDLLLESRSQFLNPEVIYPVDSFLKTGANPGSSEVLSVYSNAVGGDFDNADLHWHTDVNNGTVDIAFRFSPRMDREEMKLLPGLYVAILEEIIKAA